MLDRLPVWAQHLSVSLFATLAVWAASAVVPELKAQGGLAAIGGAVLAVFLAAVNPWLTRQYGAGSKTTDVEP